MPTYDKLLEKKSGRQLQDRHFARRIRNEPAVKSRFRQPGRERPRWIERKLGCASPARGANQERSRRRNRSDAQIGFLFSTCCAITPTKKITHHVRHHPPPRDPRPRGKPQPSPLE